MKSAQRTKRPNGKANKNRADGKNNKKLIEEGQKRSEDVSS